jgi:alpha-L-rhamnosidase
MLCNPRPAALRALWLAIALGLLGPMSAPAGGQAPALPPVAAAEMPWSARWISAPWFGEDNKWHAFRHVFELVAPPARAPLRVAAAEKYWLWINGEMAVFEGQLKRGPTPKDGYYDTLDIAPYLKPGSNTIAALVWFWGRSGYSHRSALRPGFLFEADVGGQVIESSAAWRTRVLPAYERTSDPQPNWSLPEWNVRYDARSAIIGWQEPGFADSDWAPAHELGVPPTGPWNELLARPIPLWRDGGLEEYESLDGLPSGNGGGVVRARLPYNAQITPYLRVDATAGRTIVISTDTYDSTGAISVRAEYVTRDGVQEYESFGWMSGHYVRYTIPPGVRVLELKYRETGYDTDFEGRFESDDPSLDVLWTKARRTLYVTMRDSHMDAPDRERAQWWGDWVNELAQVFYALDAQRGPLLSRKGVRELVAWRREDNALVTPVPYGVGYNSPELPLQLLAAVGRYGFWSYYVHTGDAETLAAAYPAVRDYLRLWSMGPDGFVIHRPGNWTWPDWGDNADYPVLENAWYYLALESAAKIAELVGAGADIPLYTERMSSIRAAFYPRFWNGQHFRSPGHAGAVDDRANAMAVLAGFSRPENRLALLEVLTRHRHASPYMERFVLEALFTLGGAERALARMKQRYRPMIDSWITTLWEAWEEKPFNGYNHGWAGGPLMLLSRYVAGVAPAEPGWERYAVFPQMGSLHRVDAVVPTPRGAITVTIERTPDRFHLTLNAPMGGLVGIPWTSGDRQRLTVNGVERWRAGQPVGDSSVVAVEEVGRRWLRVELPPGSSAIEALDTYQPLLQPEEDFTLSENPVRSGMVIFHFREAPALAGVYALDGRRVVDLLGRFTDPRRVVWDVTNESGTPVAPGIYFVVAKVGATTVRQRLIISQNRRR